MAVPKLQVYVLPTALDVPVNKVDWASGPKRTVLLVHDMQDYFISFWGDNCPTIEQVVVDIAALRQYCKEHSIPAYCTAQPKEQSDEDRVLLSGMWGPDLTRSSEQQKIVKALVSDEANTILVKWRYSAFHRPPLEQTLKETGRNQLIITGAYTYTGCMTTATDAFMRNIKPFMVADTLTDLSRDEHLMLLEYVAGRSGCAVMIQELLPTPAPTSRDALRNVTLLLLDEPGEPMDDESLIDYGLDSVRTTALAARWRKAHGDVDFVMLAKKPTIDAWWALLSREVK